VPPTLEEFVEYIKNGFIVSNKEIDLKELIDYIEKNGYIDSTKFIKHTTDIERYYIYKRVNVRNTNIILSNDVRSFIDKNEALKHYSSLSEMDKG
jgi:hypothetical protein